MPALCVDADPSHLVGCFSGPMLAREGGPFWGTVGLGPSGVETPSPACGMGWDAHTAADKGGVASLPPHPCPALRVQ